MRINYSLKPRSKRLKEQFKPRETLPFGVLRSDHMFLMDYRDNEWSHARIVPYGNLSIAPGATIIQYGQGIFEGIKAHMHPDKELYVFRGDRNAARLNNSAEIMCMPPVPEEMQQEAIHALIDVDRLWFPEQEGASLYTRPFEYGTQDLLGVKPSKTYTFAAILSPSGPYYAEGFTKPIRLLITEKFHRAAPGGTGAAKAVGNFGRSVRAGKFAGTMDASQVLYLDALNARVEEAGAMNHFHVTKDGEIIIPEFTDTILQSITAMSILELNNGTARQEAVMLADFLESISKGDIVEAGGCGTAAVITSVGRYFFDDGRKPLTVGNGEIGPETRRLYESLTAIQAGRAKAPEGWLQKVERR